MKPLRSVRLLPWFRLFVVEHLRDSELSERFAQFPDRQFGQGDAAAHDAHQRSVRIRNVDLMGSEREADVALVHRRFDQRVCEGLGHVARVLGAVITGFLWSLSLGQLRASN